MKRLFFFYIYAPSRSGHTKQNQSLHGLDKKTREGKFVMVSIKLTVNVYMGWVFHLLGI